MSERRARRRGMMIGAALASSRGKAAAAQQQAAAAQQQAAAAQQQAAVAQQEAAGAVDSLTSEIEKLAALRDKGLITEEEFSAKKKQLLGI